MEENTMKTIRILFVFTLFIIMFAINVSAETIQKPYTFTCGEPAVAKQVNQNFDELYQMMNLILSNIDVSSSEVNIGSAGENPNFKLYVPNSVIDIFSNHKNENLQNYGIRFINANTSSEHQWGFWHMISDNSFQIHEYKDEDGNGNIWDNPHGPRLIITEGGNVGIGTAPLSKFDVNGNFTLRGDLNLKSANDSIAILSYNNEPVYQSDTYSEKKCLKIGYYHQSVFNGAGSSYTDSGNVQIKSQGLHWGSYENNNRVDLNGSEIFLESARSPKGQHYHGAIKFRTGDNLSDRMVITGNDGFIGVGISNPASLLDVAGNIKANNIGSSSDMRLKKDISPLTHSLKKITSLKGVFYYWKTDEYPDRNFEDSKQIGLIAQDVEPIIPEVVHTDNEGYKSVRYNKLTPVLIEALKELKTKNDCLQQQLNNQQKEIDELKSLVNQLIKNI